MPYPNELAVTNEQNRANMKGFQKNYLNPWCLKYIKSYNLKL